MFYVRTGDCLQRTSNWLEKLDAQMAHIVASHQCEWITTLASSERLEHVNTFVNTDARDRNVQFTRERGEIKPLIRMELKSHAN